MRDGCEILIKGGDGSDGKDRDQFLPGILLPPPQLVMMVSMLSDRNLLAGRNWLKP
jgi:hypothetical protein